MTGENYYKKINATYHQEVNVETCENCGAVRKTTEPKKKHTFTLVNVAYTKITKTKHTVKKSYVCDNCEYAKSKKSTVKHAWKLQSITYTQYSKSTKKINKKKVHKVTKYYKCACGKTKTSTSSGKHVYVDDGADLDMAINIIFNAKTQRIGVCNACESLLIHKNVLADIPRFLYGIMRYRL